MIPLSEVVFVENPAEDGRRVYNAKSIQPIQQHQRGVFSTDVFLKHAGQYHNGMMSWLA